MGEGGRCCVEDGDGVLFVWCVVIRIGGRGGKQVGGCRMGICRERSLMFCSTVRFEMPKEHGIMVNI